LDLPERYNLLLRSLEDDTALMLNRVLDTSFNRLVRRARIQIQSGYTDPAQRNLALLQEFRQLVPTYRPDKIDAYDRILRALLRSASRYGITVASELANELTPENPRIDVNIPLEAIASAAGQAKGYLRRHGETFAVTATEIVAQGLAEGRSIPSTVTDLRQRLNLTKSRATTIVRTESLRAYNDAANTYYASRNIDVVLYYATADDRTCPICAPRAGRLYRREDVRVPLHPQCRCYLAPWDPEIAELNASYDQARIRHRDEVQRALKKVGTVDPSTLNRAALFEQIQPVPLQ
jgi:SPP1 gp7 family putative phage head morphogenesis protein